MKNLSENIICHFDRRSVYNGFYIYLICDDENVPFYIGKGTKDRWRHHFYPNSLSHHHHKNFKIKKLFRENKTINIFIDMYSEDNPEECFNREIELIAKYKRKCDGGPLTNLTEGGGQDASWRDNLSEQEFLEWRKQVNENNGWSDIDLVKKAKLLYHYRGLDGNQIANLEEFKGLSPWTIRQWICKNSTCFNYVLPHLKDKKGLIEEKVSEAKSLYLNSHFNKKEVASILGLDYSFVRRNLNGITKEEQSAGGTS